MLSFFRCILFPSIWGTLFPMHDSPWIWQTCLELKECQFSVLKCFFMFFQCFSRFVLGFTVSLRCFNRGPLGQEKRGWFNSWLFQDMPRRRLSVTRCCTRCNLEGFPSVNGSADRSDAMIHLTNVVLFLVSYGIGILVYLEMSAGTKISWTSRKKWGGTCHCVYCRLLLAILNLCLTACWIWKLDFLTHALKKTKKSKLGICCNVCQAVQKHNENYDEKRGGKWDLPFGCRNPQISMVDLNPGEAGKPSCLHLETSGVIRIIGYYPWNILKWLLLFRGDSMLG